MTLMLAELASLLAQGLGAVGGALLGWKISALIVGRPFRGPQ